MVRVYEMHADCECLGAKALKMGFSSLVSSEIADETCVVVELMSVERNQQLSF